MVQPTFFQLILQYIRNKTNAILHFWWLLTLLQMEHFYKHAWFPFKHNSKLFYITKFPELQNFCSAQSQLPPICNTSKGGQGWCEKMLFLFGIKNPNHEIQKLKQQQLQPWCPFFHMLLKENKKQKNPKQTNALKPPSYSFCLMRYWICVCLRALTLSSELISKMHRLTLLHVFLSRISNKSSYLVWHEQ